MGFLGAARLPLGTGAELCPSPSISIPCAAFQSCSEGQRGSKSYGVTPRAPRPRWLQELLPVSEYKGGRWERSNSWVSSWPNAACWSPLERALGVAKPLSNQGWRQAGGGGVDE